ncbi:MAG TPA: hypothetical protein VHE81_09180 [Lacipirellulaceae bacterium]|nr:hypothetical protein [Lacipirellulaceae bacterium]
MAVAPDEKPTTIPLNQIWAYEMPGTRNILELDVASKNQDARRIVSSITESSFGRAAKRKFKDLARPGFAVTGTGNTALRAAHAVLVVGAKPRTEFSTNDEITLIFFSELVSRCLVQIHKVERTGDQIEILYELKPDIGGLNFTNFALIPLGKLPAGKYEVKMRQLPHELTTAEIKYHYKPLDEKWSRNFLCKPFNFTVAKKGE